MNNPVIWIAGGIGIALIAFLFMDLYASHLGILWNIMNGEVGPVPYRFVLAVAIGLVLYGVYLWSKKS